MEWKTKPDIDASYYWIDSGKGTNPYIGLLRKDFEGTWYIDCEDYLEFFEDDVGFLFWGPIPEPPPLPEKGPA